MVASSGLTSDDQELATATARLDRSLAERRAELGQIRTRLLAAIRAADVEEADAADAAGDRLAVAEEDEHSPLPRAATRRRQRGLAMLLLLNAQRSIPPAPAVQRLPRARHLAVPSPARDPSRQLSTGVKLRSAAHHTTLPLMGSHTAAKTTPAGDATRKEQVHYTYDNYTRRRKAYIGKTDRRGDSQCFY